MHVIKTTFAAAAFALASFASLSSASAEEAKLGNLTINDPWSRQSPMAADVMAGYVVISNAGAEDDRLVKVTSGIAPTIQLHDMKMDGDMMKMVELPEGIPVPAGKAVELKPKSLHIMFMGVKAQPKEGETFTGTLVFEKAGSIEVPFKVMAPNAGMN